MSKLRPALNDIEALLSDAVREQMVEEIAANEGAEVLWWGKLSASSQPSHSIGDKQAELGCFQVDFVEAAACGNDNSVLAHFPYMERGDVVLHNHPSGGVQPSDADMLVANQLALQGIGFYIVNNQLSHICVVAKPVLEVRETPLELDELSNLLGPDGPLAQKALQGGGEYEERLTQQQLLRSVGGGFNQNKIVVAEGGTGIGKSFAYLLPAAFWAVGNKQRVVISTATINLQQQLIEKDIPLIREISGLSELQAELVKGRSNYLCRRRLKLAEEEAKASLGLEEEGGSPEDNGENTGESFAAELASIAQWGAVTQDGSLSDLGFRPRSGAWSQVCGESDSCLGLRCEFHESCFIIQARRRAAAAHILVVNHHLLFADLELRSSGDFGYEKTAVLPPYRHVVLDEAHNIERSAQSFFSQSLTKFSAQRSLRRLYSKRRNREGGIWTQLRRYAELEVASAEDLPDILACSEALEQALASLDGTAQQVLEAARYSGGTATGPAASRQSSHLRIPEHWQCLSTPIKEALDQQLWPQLECVRTALGALLNALNQVYALLENVLEGEEQKLLMEWRQLTRRLDGLRDVVLHWLDWRLRTESQDRAENKSDNEDYQIERVFWLERHQRSGAVSGPGGSSQFQRLVSTQINIGGLLQQVLYEPMRSVIMVSATLTVRGSFDYWFSRVGLADLQQQAMAGTALDSWGGELDGPIWEEDYDQTGADELEAGGKPQEEDKPLLDSEKLSASVYASPFDYHGRVDLLLASDAPNPSMSRDYDAYVGRFALEALGAMGGRSLLLFTSYAALNQCYDFLLDSGAIWQADLLRQGDDDNARLLQRFKDEEGLSLLATDSFWEGVDAPGSTLMQVLLCRLPFRSPDDPIVAAHTEYLERRGENAFFHYSLPEAILRFRQGFGRLMRRGSDRGLVVVLDPRIVNKRYGQDFLDSLPGAKMVRGDFASLQRHIENYAREYL